MALPIKDTPILTGKDSRNFDRWMKENESKKVTSEEYKRIQEAGKKFNFEVQQGVACDGCFEP